MDISVVVPFEVPDSITAAPGMGKPSGSRIVPEISTSSLAGRLVM